MKEINIKIVIKNEKIGTFFHMKGFSKSVEDRLLIVGILCIVLCGCATTLGTGKQQYLRLISDQTYSGVETVKSEVSRAAPTLEMGYGNLQNFTRDQLKQRLDSRMITQEEYDSTIKDLDMEAANYAGALGTVKQVPPTMDSVLYGMGVDVYSPRRPKDLINGSVLPFAAGALTGAAIAY